MKSNRFSDFVGTPWSNIENTHIHFQTSEKHNTSNVSIAHFNLKVKVGCQISYVQIKSHLYSF